MTEQTQLALINFTGLVSTAIARQTNGKDVDWRGIVDAQETLATALQSELSDPYATQSPCSASLASPALTHQSEIYPPRYRGRVPWKIKMACTVRPDLEWLCRTHGTVAVMDEVYECWVNMHGAVAAICRNGEKLGIKPAEFDVVEWHTQTPNAEVSEGGTRDSRIETAAQSRPSLH